MTFSWSGADGWVRLQATLDAMFAHVEDLLVDEIDPRAAAVLDVGCGTGATTLAIARKLGPHARCVGVDISEQMIALARRRAAGGAVEFVVADAGRHAFDPGAFDVIASRFGVMFSSSPSTPSPTCGPPPAAAARCGPSCGADPRRPRS